MQGCVCAQADGYRAGEIHHCLTSVCNFVKDQFILSYTELLEYLELAGYSV